MRNELRAGSADECREMKEQPTYVCPRCDYALLPVHAVEGTKRRVIAMTCPEPYCDHMQMIPRDQAPRERANGVYDSQRAVN